MPLFSILYLLSWAPGPFSGKFFLPVGGRGTMDVCFFVVGGAIDTPPCYAAITSVGAVSSPPARPGSLIAVGREKVNCPVGAREAGLGHDPARRSSFICSFVRWRFLFAERSSRRWAASFFLLPL